MRQSTKTQRHKETLRGERRSGYLSVPRLSTSNPIRSLTRLRVKLQTGSEWLREDEQDDPEWSRSCSWCYGPAVCLCVFVLKVNLDPSTPLSLALVCVVVIVATRWHTDIKIPACKQDSSQEFKVAVRLFPARLHFDPCRKMTSWGVRLNVFPHMMGGLSGRHLGRRGTLHRSTEGTSGAMRCRPLRLHIYRSLNMQQKSALMLESGELHHVDKQDVDEPEDCSLVPTERLYISPPAVIYTLKHKIKQSFVCHKNVIV
ncbi:hypothetical protein ABVT39_022032 [Epinephelus coioides]